MGKNKSILITRPNHDYTTNYLYFWAEEVIKLAQRRGFSVYDLKGRKASRKQFENYVQKNKPSFLFLNGHGDAVTVTGYNNEPLIDSSSSVLDYVIYARSCDAGRKLGIDLVKKGTKTFIGYTRKFIFGYSSLKITRPKDDDMAKLFLEPSNLVASTLIKGHTSIEAHHRSKDAMYKNFLRMISGWATYEQRYAARWLWGNIRSQVLIGDQNSKI